MRWEDVGSGVKRQEMVNPQDPRHGKACRSEGFIQEVLRMRYTCVVSCRKYSETRPVPPPYCHGSVTPPPCHPSAVRVTPSFPPPPHDPAYPQSGK